MIRHEARGLSCLAIVLFCVALFAAPSASFAEVESSEDGSRESPGSDESSEGAEPDDSEEASEPHDSSEGADAEDSDEDAETDNSEEGADAEDSASDAAAEYPNDGAEAENSGEGAATEDGGEASASNESGAGSDAGAARSEVGDSNAPESTAADDHEASPEQGSDGLQVGGDALAGLSDEELANLSDEELADVLAEELEQEADEDRVTVVTASRYDTATGNVPEAVSVIGAEEASLRSAIHGDDLMRNVPSLSIRRHQGPANAYPHVLQIRGIAGIARVLVLVDGLPLNDALTGAANLNVLPTERVRRIEVVRGPYSALWGSYAMGGVIHLVTQPGGVDPGAMVSGAVGPHGTYQLSSTLAGQVGWFEAAASYDLRSSDNYLALEGEPNVDYRHHRFLLRLDANRGGRAAATLTAGLYNSDVGFNQYVDLRESMGVWFRNEGRNDKDNYFARLAGRFRPHRTLELQTSVGFTTQWARFHTEPVVLEGTMPASDITESTSLGTEVRLEGSGRWAFRPWGAWVLGVDQVWDFGSWDNRSYDTGEYLLGMDASVSVTSVYTQLEFSFLEDRLRLIAGARLDYHSTYGIAVSPRGGVTYEPVRGTVLRVAAGRAFRSPALMELYSPPWMRIPPYQTEGTPTLDPETLWSVDGGVEQRLGPLDVRVTGYYTEGDSPIMLRLQEDNVERYLNGEGFRSAGVESELSLGRRWPVEARLTYAWTWTEDLETGEKLDYVPEHLLGFVIMGRFRLGSWALEASFDLLFTGPQMFAPAREPENRQEHPASVVGNATVRGRRGPLTVFVDIRNLWNAKYAETAETVAPRFMVMGGLRIELDGWGLAAGEGGDDDE